MKVKTDRACGDRPGGVVPDDQYPYPMNSIRVFGCVSVASGAAAVPLVVHVDSRHYEQYGLVVLSWTSGGALDHGAGW